jgi:hypothetical protein
LLKGFFRGGEAIRIDIDGAELRQATAGRLPFIESNLAILVAIQGSEPVIPRQFLGQVLSGVNDWLLLLDLGLRLIPEEIKGKIVPFSPLVPASAVIPTTPTLLAALGHSFFKELGELFPGNLAIADASPFRKLLQPLLGTGVSAGLKLGDDNHVLATRVAVKHEVRNPPGPLAGVASTKSASARTAGVASTGVSRTTGITAALTGGASTTGTTEITPLAGETASPRTAEPAIASTSTRETASPRTAEPTIASTSTGESPPRTTTAPLSTGHIHREQESSHAKQSNREKASAKHDRYLPEMYTGRDVPPRQEAIWLE